MRVRHVSAGPISPMGRAGPLPTPCAGLACGERAVPSEAPRITTIWNRVEAMEAAVQWLTVVGFPFTLLGLAYAIWVSRKARSAAEAAEQASLDATGRSVELRLQVQVAGLTRLSDHLDTAQASDNHELARAVVALWDSAATEVLGTIRGTSIDSDGLRRLVGESRAAVVVARDALHTPQPVSESIRTLRRRIADVTSQAGELAAARHSQPGPPAPRRQPNGRT